MYVAGVPASLWVTAFIIYSPKRTLYKKLFFLQCFWTKSAFQFESTKKNYAWTNKKSLCTDKYKRRQRKHLVSGHQDWDFTQRGWHFDSAEANIKTHVERTRTSAKYWKFLSKNILWQGKRYFSEEYLKGQTPLSWTASRMTYSQGLRDVGCKFYINIRFKKV